MAGPVEPLTKVTRSGSSFNWTGMRAFIRLASTKSATAETDPTRTPRKVTGDPGPRPPTDPSKYTTAFVLDENACGPPKNRMATTTMIRAPSTKPPTAAGLADGMGRLR